MAAKTKCPTCGAKNDIANHRCRICTAVINPDAAAPVVEEPVTPLGIDHFDAGEINRQIRPARERFGSGDGALAARLAAARGTSPEPLHDEAPAPAPTPAPTSGPVEYDDEPFDPDALFRDMG
ncbi:MAG: hypothetical protein ACXWA3_01210 [Acidimicrobiales bacterium]